MFLLWEVEEPLLQFSDRISFDAYANQMHVDDLNV